MAEAPTTRFVRVPSAMLWAILRATQARKPEAGQVIAHNRIRNLLRAEARAIRIARSLLIGSGWTVEQSGQPWAIVASVWQREGKGPDTFVVPKEYRARRDEAARRWAIPLHEAQVAPHLTPSDVVSVGGTGFGEVTGFHFRAWAPAFGLSAEQAEYVERGVEFILKRAHAAEEATDERREADVLPEGVMRAIPDVREALKFWQGKDASPPTFGDRYDAEGNPVQPVEPPLEDDLAIEAEAYAQAKREAQRTPAPATPAGANGTPPASAPAAVDV